MSTIDPPLPRITSLTQSFWDAARYGRLELPKCRSCGMHFFRPEVACTHCFSTDWEWIVASGRGSLYSFTIIHRAPTPGLRTPLVFAVVELEEGPMMYSNIIGTDGAPLSDAQLQIGMPLQVVFTEVAGVVLPNFSPA